MSLTAYMSRLVRPWKKKKKKRTPDRRLIRWRIPVNADNGLMLLAQSIDSYRKLTSLMRTLCSQKYAENL